MFSWTKSWGTLAVLAVAVTGFLPTTAEAAVFSPAEGLRSLNEFRAKVGVPPVPATNERMNEGARLHLLWMRQNRRSLSQNWLSAHDESPGQPGYTPEGAAAGSSSNLATKPVAPGVDTVESIWGGAVYHRQGILNPRLRSTWFYGSEDGAVIGVQDAGINGERIPAIDNSPAARTPTLTAYPYPYNGQTQVPTAFDNSEVPDPRDEVPGRPQFIGYPLSLQFNGPWKELWSSALTSASLQAATGESVPVTISGPFLLPHQPLKPRTWYQARAIGECKGQNDDGSVAAHPIDVTWRFQTRAEASTGLGSSVKKRVRMRVSARFRGRVVRVSVRRNKELKNRTVSIEVTRKVGKRWTRVKGGKLKLARTTSARRFKVSRRHRTLRVLVTVGSYRKRVREVTTLWQGRSVPLLVRRNGRTQTR